MSIRFVLFDRHPDLPGLWREAFETLVPQECRNRVTIVQTQRDFEALNIKFDCVVSPANSFGKFDGGFDQILSDTLAPADDSDALTRAAQAVLYKRWRGYAPPGTCTLIPLAGTPCAANRFDCRFVALCPTMRFPGSVTWHKEIVYNCVWSLLVEIDAHNAVTSGETGTERIETVVMTGLAAGTGAYSPRECAKQTALAFAHFEEASANPEKWAALTWGDIVRMPLNPRLPSEE
ncbi:macro domain-like protein [Pilatotrama ljubarskyi]|nr:macro domain-like protein [Pilatotrama ljubarskyi]